MLKSGREKTILKQGLLIIGIMAGLYFFVLGPFLRDNTSILDDELERKTSDINRLFAATGTLPSKEGFDRLEKEKLALEDKLQDLIDFVDPQKPRISETESEAALYFIERLHSSIKRFSELSASKGIELPDNLGFGGGLPKDSMVEPLLRQLETVEMVIETLLESENIEIATIKPLKAMDYIEPLSKEVFYTELPVQISIKTDTETFMDLLLELKNASPVVSLKEMHVKSGDDIGSGDIDASLVLSTFKIVREESR